MVGWGIFQMNFVEYSKVRWGPDWVIAHKNAKKGLRKEQFKITHKEYKRGVSDYNKLTL